MILSAIIVLKSLEEDIILRKRWMAKIAKMSDGVLTSPQHRGCRPRLQRNQVKE